ncbi:MAG TPA: nucleotidyltransferase family protein [Stellaceae bacterium]|nr:nucleotidyltransferase family protein [Stellaceae bacterium]
MEAVVLAGGLGTRLHPRVSGLPKAMAPVAGRPFLAWLLDELADAGFRRAILSVGHLGEAIRSAFGGTYHTLDLLYAVEASPLGTGGALRHALALAGPGDEPIWVLNGDSIVRLAHAEMWAAHEIRRSNPLALTMALVSTPDAGRYGTVETREGRVTQFNPTGGRGVGIINAGTYLLHRRIFEGGSLPPAFSFEADFLARSIDRLEIAAFATDGWFIDIGVPADYDRAQTELPAALSREPCPANATIRAQR